MTGIASSVAGFRRPDGTVGARNHVLVLPSVVCAGMAASAIAGDDAIAIVHQHGCDHVGEDAAQTSRVFLGLAGNPNVASTLLVGLGCETIQGRELYTDLSALAKGVEYFEIQACGGSAQTVVSGRSGLEDLVAGASRIGRSPAPPDAVVYGLATGPRVQTELLEALRERILAGGASLLVALRDLPPDLGNRWRAVPVVEYGAAAPAGLAVTFGVSSLSEQQTGLAASGAQVVISLVPARHAPTGTPISPVLSVATDRLTYEALHDDFDLDGSGADAGALSERIVGLAREVFNGRPTAAERRGAQEFALHRLTRST